MANEQHIFLPLMYIRDRLILFLSRQFKQFETTAEKEEKAIACILDRLDQMEEMFDLFVNTVEEDPDKSEKALIDRRIPQLNPEQRSKAMKSNTLNNIRHFYAEAIAYEVLFQLIEELLIYAGCRFVESDSEVSQMNLAMLKHFWRKRYGTRRPVTMLFRLPCVIRDEICFLEDHPSSEYY